MIKVLHGISGQFRAEIGRRYMVIKHLMSLVCISCAPLIFLEIPRVSLQSISAWEVFRSLYAHSNK